MLVPELAEKRPKKKRLKNAEQRVGAAEAEDCHSVSQSSEATSDVKILLRAVEYRAAQI